MTPFPPNWLASQPSPQALQTATDALRRRYVLPETMHHPAVAVQVLELASLLSAYGLIPTEPGSDSISNASGFSRLRTKPVSKRAPPPIHKLRKEGRARPRKWAPE
jgi:hypothetical protein